MTVWIVSCNIKHYDVVGAFNELLRIDWKQSTKVEPGDIVYIYVGVPYQSIMFKCYVSKTNLPFSDIDDARYVISGETYLNYGNYMELELVDKYAQGVLSLEKLRKHGLTGRIQGPRRAEGDVLRFLMSKDGGRLFCVGGL